MNPARFPAEVRDGYQVDLDRKNHPGRDDFLGKQQSNSIEQLISNGKFAHANLIEKIEVRQRFTYDDEILFQLFADREFAPIRAGVVDAVIARLIDRSVVRSEDRYKSV